MNGLIADVNNLGWCCGTVGKATAYEAGIVMWVLVQILALQLPI